MSSSRLHVLVEIPKGSRNKYEWDEELKAIKLDRFLFSSVVYPTDYGFIPEAAGEDGDPLDAMVCVTEPTFPGCVIPAQVVALFRMRDEKGIDDKVVCVPLHDPNWNHVKELDDLPEPLRDEISHFFSIYKQPEGKHVKVDGWYPREQALKVIDEARERHRVEQGDDDLHYVDEGDGPPVVFWHGEPTWSYLWRKVIPPVRDAGFRCVAPDLPGFGRSPKPRDLAWFTYDRLTEAATGFVEDLDLQDATFVVHDWGGPIGLRAASQLGDRVTRIVILNTGLFTGSQRMTDAWKAFRDFVERTEDLPVGMLVRGACKTDPGDDVIAQYEAPFETPADKAGPRALPLLIPLSEDAPGAAEGRATLAWLRDWSGPLLMLWGEEDPVLPPATGRRFAEAIGRPPPELIPGASHFLQEDAGDEVGRRIAEWLTASASR